MMFIDFKDFVSAPEQTTRSVLKFVGADVDLPAYSFQTMPPGMQVSRERKEGGEQGWGGRG